RGRGAGGVTPGATVFAMAKKPRRAAAADASAGENPRRPCPCGSGKRYKACHGARDDVIVSRPLAGLAAECELVAMREFLPSATAPLPTRDGRVATITTVLPGASDALVRAHGDALLRLAGRRASAGRTARSCSACRCRPARATCPRTSRGHCAGPATPSPGRRCR